jgi:hypothetical protein
VLSVLADGEVKSDKTEVRDCKKNCYQYSSYNYQKKCDIDKSAKLQGA